MTLVQKMPPKFAPTPEQRAQTRAYIAMERLNLRCWEQESFVLSRERWRLLFKIIARRCCKGYLTRGVDMTSLRMPPYPGDFPRPEDVRAIDPRVRDLLIELACGYISWAVYERSHYDIVGRDFPFEHVTSYWSDQDRLMMALTVQECAPSKSVSRYVLPDRPETVTSLPPRADPQTKVAWVFKTEDLMQRYLTSRWESESAPR